MSAFIEEHRARFGVEPICRALDVSASAYYHRATGERSERSREDERLLQTIRKTHADNYFAYGSRRMWKALLRAGEQVGRSRVERLMRQHGIQGAKRRGKPCYIVPCYFRYHRYPSSWIRRLPIVCQYLLLTLALPYYRRGLQVVVGEAISSVDLPDNDEAATSMIAASIAKLDPNLQHG